MSFLVVYPEKTVIFLSIREFPILLDALSAKRGYYFLKAKSLSKHKTFKIKKAGSHIVIRDLRLVFHILHCPYTQISPSLRLIFSPLFLNNPLINLKSFMNG